ncbi:hypothetical protein ACE193_17710 [Bernardetia sp. OM2101]|uniref:DUF6970 domain-containing protein n=1 Tax=Bernardetia sp. OM2101 TaxID=3344876 RepID=UPI0035D058ED
MKNLIFFAIAFLFIFTSCFETTNEVTVVSEIPPTEERNIMECELVIDFIERVNSCSIKYIGENRASIRKFKFRNETVFLLNDTDNYECSKYPNAVVLDSKCNIVCTFSMIPSENSCPDWNSSNVEFIETIWQDNR